MPKKPTTPAAKRMPTARAKPTPSAKRTPARPLDVAALLARVDAWCADQRAVQARLVRGAPLTATAIDRIPQLLAEFPWELPTPYDPARFVLPAGYRALLAIAGGAHVEYVADGARATYDVFRIFRPGSCAKAHTGAGPTLCDSWSPAGTTVDDREITTTELISFATMGYTTEASRWCFYTGGDGPPTIFEESNDYECLAGRYVDTGEWISDLDKPVFSSFEAWLATVVDVMTSRPLDPDATDAVVQAIYEQRR